MNFPTLSLNSVSHPSQKIVIYLFFFFLNDEGSRADKDILLPLTDPDNETAYDLVRLVDDLVNLYIAYMN